MADIVIVDQSENTNVCVTVQESEQSVFIHDVSDGENITLTDATDKVSVVTVETPNEDKLVLSVSGVGPRGPKGDTGPPAMYFLLPTNTPIGGNRAIGAVDGFAVYADCSVPINAIGMSMGAVSAGEDVKVQFGDTMTVPGASWNPGSLVFLSTNGVLTQTVPSQGISQVVGIAQSQDLLLIDIQMPITLT